MSSLSEKFPDEIWLAIFTDKELEYKHLKRLIGVSKHFRELIKSSVFDQTLFKTPLSKCKKLAVGEQVAIHPMVNRHLNLVCTDQESAFIFISNEYDKDRTTKSTEEILKFPALSEYATNPTTSVVLIDMLDGYIVKNVLGVTVLDIINETIKFWNFPLEEEMAYFDEYSDEEDEFSHNRPLRNRIDYLYEDDHNGWAGWQYAKIAMYLNRPTIFLKAGRFDS